MRILFDCSSIHSGGGLTQLQGILSSLPSSTEDQITVLIRKSKKDLIKGNFRLILCSDSTLIRFWQQLLFGLIYRNFDATFTVFGIGLGFLPKKTVRIINVALPIICYDDSPFWTELSLVTRLQKRIKVLLRRKFISSRSDIIFCESPTMRRRLIKFAHFPADKIRILPPIKSHLAVALEQEDKGHHSADKIIFLYVTGADVHKNIDKLVDMSLRYEKELKDLHVEFRVTTTGERNNSILTFIGPTFGEDLITEYAQATYVVNISDLESISNNFIESKAIQKPMLLNSVDFAISCVRVPYTHADVRDKDAFFEAILRIINDKHEFPQETFDISIDPETRLNRIFDTFHEFTP